MECTESFTTLLSEFRCVFTAASLQICLCLMTGWVLSHRRRFVTELIWSSGCTRRGHRSHYHRFFSQAACVLDVLCMVLVMHSLIVVWLHQEGHRHLQFPDRPWYAWKEEPPFADMLTTLRRLSWQEKFRTLPIESRRVKKALAQIIEFLSLSG
jgi:hypothetical protein